MLPAPAALASPPIGLRLSRTQVRRAQSFWTAARMEKAEPLETPPPTSAPETEPSSEAIGTSAIVPDPTAPGVRVNGAIFVSGGRDHGYGRCSGTSVSSPNRSLVFTAGHCVFDEGHWWARNWVFVPAYRYGERPFGTFAAKWIGTTPGWLNHGNFNFDVGVGVVKRNERGETLAAAVGADKIAFDRSPDQHFEVFGYPVALPFNGTTLRVCSQASYVGHGLQAWLAPGPLQIAVTCDVSPGSSGGGWVIDGDVLDGVTSEGWPDDPTTVYGPYFGNAVKHLYERASRVK